MAEFRVLLADGSETVIGMLSYLLVSAGYAVSAASDGLNAVKTAFREAPDLVLMDARMPRLAGTQACRLLKSDPATRDIPVILLSSQDEGIDRMHATRAGADRFLPKDSSPEAILSAAGGCLDGRTPRSRVAEDEEPHPPGDVEILLRLSHVLEARLFEATLLNEIGKIGRDVEDFESTIRLTDKTLAELASHQAMAAVFSDGVTLECVIVYRCPADEGIREATRAWVERLRAEAGVPVAPDRAKFSEFSFDGGRSGATPRAELFRPTAVCPIRFGGMVKGLLALFSDDGGAGEGEAHLTDSLLQHGFLVMENAWLYRQIARISVTDGLTGLVNHRHFVESLKKEDARSSRYRVPFSILMIDIDHFKRVNDVYGHPVGDTVLREISVILADSCRNTDLPARYGGEEFALLLPETTAAEAVVVAGRVREAVERKVFASPSPLLRCTVSIGVSSFDPEAHLGDSEILNRADEALYEAKRSGRNRVCLR